MKIYEKDFCECFCGSYSIGTDGHTGGDRTITEICFNIPTGVLTVSKSLDSLKITAYGDSELNYFMEAFEWMAAKLKKSIQENKSKEVICKKS